MSASVITLPPCRDCGKTLNIQEEHFYEYRCEGCEGAWRNRLRAWWTGSPDAEFDALFGGKQG